LQLLDFGHKQQHPLPAVSDSIASANPRNLRLIRAPPVPNRALDYSRNSVPREGIGPNNRQNRENQLDR
jgi:hypothetical protein